MVRDFATRWPRKQSYSGITEVEFHFVFCKSFTFLTHRSPKRDDRTGTAHLAAVCEIKLSKVLKEVNL